MRTSESLDALFPKTRQMILSAMLLDPHRRWYMRELARHVRRTVSSLQRELDSLVRAGILRREHEGKHVYFQAEVNSPIFEELRGLLIKTVAVTDVLRQMLRPFKSRIEWAFVFGSIARSEEHGTSDVDLMIIGRIGLAEFSGPLRKAERKIGRPVNPVVFSRKELAEKVAQKQHFALNALQSKKIFVLGDPSEFDQAFGK
jgi:predicted nucleotidyltransferase